MELRIKEVLKEREMTNITLADKVGITAPNMSNIVNGKTNPSLETLNKIALVLDVHISDLFANTDNSIINCPHCGGKIRIEKEGEFDN